MSRFIVMTAAANMPSSCWGRYGKVAVVETNGVDMPQMIHPRHKAVVRIVEVWDRLNIGHTSRCAFRRGLAAAQAMADQLNAALVAQSAMSVAA